MENNTELAQLQRDYSKLLTLSSLMQTSLMQYRGTTGKTFNGRRDIYASCGYPESLEFYDYYQRYKRGDIAKRIIDAFPDATWRRKPRIYDVEGEVSEFEDAWVTIEDKTKLFNHLYRADIFAGIGRFSVLYLGFDDAGKFDVSMPVRKKSKLLYVFPYLESDINIIEYDKDITSPRFGEPLVYEITHRMSTETLSRRVHYTRVIHLAENCLESIIYGSPRMEIVWNRLQDLETIIGGSAEMFWKGGFPGFSFEADADTQWTAQAIQDMSEELDKYMNDLQRYLRLQGVKTNQLHPQVADPDSHVSVQIKMISAATGIPQRILTGAEAGRLASGQDKANWNDRVDERRSNYVEPLIIRTLIDRLIELQVLPAPSVPYKIKWLDISIVGESDKADIGKVKTDALVNYASALEKVQHIMNPRSFLTKVLSFTEDEADDILNTVDVFYEEPVAKIQPMNEDSNNEDSKNEDSKNEDSKNKEQEIDNE